VTGGLLGGAIVQKIAGIIITGKFNIHTPPHQICRVSIKLFNRLEHYENSNSSA
jgi:hypothetical protein